MTDNKDKALQEAPQRAAAFLQSEQFGVLKGQLDEQVRLHHEQIAIAQKPGFNPNLLSRFCRMIGGDREQVLEDMSVQVLVRTVTPALRRHCGLFPPQELLRFHQRPDTVSVLYFVEIGRDRVRTALIPLLEERVMFGFILKSDALLHQEMERIMIGYSAVADVLDAPEPRIDPPIVLDWFAALQGQWS